LIPIGIPILKLPEFTLAVEVIAFPLNEDGANATADPTTAIKVETTGAIFLCLKFSLIKNEGI
jgi:hypothetical protein